MGAFDILLQQHRAVEECLAQLDDAQHDGTPPHELTALTGELVALLRLHTLLEEQHLYPLLLRVGGRAQAREEAEDHLTLRELLDELLEEPPGSDGWLAHLVALEDVVVAHLQWEEARVLPRLATALDAQEQEDLGRALSATCDGVLGRGRPHAPGAERSVDAPRWGG
jgi:hypothetical protein